MAKYLVRANYLTEGVKGLLKDGGSKRQAVVSKMIEALGGRVEAFYYAFGDDDTLVIIDLPDNVTAAAMSLKIAATGAVSINTTVLLTPEEIDQATKKAVKYRVPGK